MWVHLRKRHETFSSARLSKHLTRALVCSWLLLVPFGIAAGDDVTGAVVVVTTGPRAAGQDTLRRVVASSIELHLGQEGITAHDAGTWLPGVDPLQALRPGIAGIDADFALIATLDVREADVVIELSLFRLDNGAVLARARAIEPISLMLDRVVTRLCAEIVERSRRHLSLAAEARRTRAADLPSPTVGHTDGSTAGVPHAEPDRPDATSTAAGSLPADSREAPSVSSSRATAVAPGLAVPERAGDPRPVARRFTLSARFAPLLPIDDAARYLDSGHGVGVSAAVRVFPRGWFGIGLSAHSAGGMASGMAASAAYQFSGVGISALFSGTGMPAVPYLRVTGGLAMLSAHTEGLGQFSSTVPYAAGDIGTLFQLFGPFALEIAAGVSAYWTGTTLLLGIVPGIGLALRF